MAPRPYLVVACSYPGRPYELRAVEREARAIAYAQPLATALANPSCEGLRRVLCESDPQVLHLTCHGDAPLLGEKVPLLVGGGDAAMALGAGWWTALLRPHAPRLRVAYLGGCETLALGRALHEGAGLGSVVCWGSRVVDRAAEVFGTAFAAALCSPPGTRGAAAAAAVDEAACVRAAFGAACAAVLEETEEGCLDNGMRCTVQKFALVDPSDASVHHCVGSARQCRMCPWKREGDVCPWAGRLLPLANSLAGDGGDQSAARPPRQLRGRIAAGVPRLLQTDKAR